MVIITKIYTDRYSALVGVRVTISASGVIYLLLAAYIPPVGLSGRARGGRAAGCA